MRIPFHIPSSVLIPASTSKCITHSMYVPLRVLNYVQVLLDSLLIMFPLCSYFCVYVPVSAYVYVSVAFHPYFYS